MPRWSKKEIKKEVKKEAKKEVKKEVPVVKEVTDILPTKPATGEINRPTQAIK